MPHITTSNLPPEPVATGQPADLPDNLRQAGMRWITWDGILASTMMTLTDGVFITGFALLTGASQTLIGLLCGLPRLSHIMQPLGAYFVERFNMRKRISVWVFGPARMLWLLVILLPLVGYTGGESLTALYVLLGVALLSSMMAGFAAASWLTWMADLIPEKTRGAFFGRRTMLAGTTSAVIAFLAGRFIDQWKAQAGTDDPNGFFLVFAFGVVCGLASWYTLIKCPEPPIREALQPEQPEFSQLLKEAWGDLNFRRLIYGVSLLTFATWIAGPFFNVYMIEVMELPYSLMTIFAGFSAFGSLLMVRLWGRLSDHFGNRTVMITCLVGAAALPIPWLFSAGGAWWPIAAAQVLGGASWSGIFLTQMNLVFKISPDEHKSVHIAIFYALSNAPSLLAPVVGGLFLQHTAQWAWHVGSWTFLNYHVIMLASSLLRFAALPVLRGVKEPKARRVVHMFRVLSHMRSFNPMLGLQHYVHVVSDATSTGTRGAVAAVRRTARRLRRTRRDDKVEGAD